jgi:putative oxidoreductase
MTKINKSDFALLLIRLAFGFRLIYGTADNVFSWERMLEFREFLAANGFPLPLMCAVVSVYLQFLAGLSWMLGYQVRISSLLMIVNFAVAIIGVHLLNGDSYLGMAPAVHLLVVAVVLYLLGAGKYGLSRGEMVSR